MPLSQRARKLLLTIFLLLAPLLVGLMLYFAVKAPAPRAAPPQEKATTR